MATRYYSQEPRTEWEAVERWENEGGRLGQKHDYIVDAISDNYRRPMHQVMTIKRVGKRQETAPLKSSLAFDKAKSITGQTLVLPGERPVPSISLSV